MLAIGLMSGTSLDGIDASLIETDGEQLFKSIENFYLPYSNDFQYKLRNVINTHQNWLDTEIELTKLHNIAISELIKKNNVPRETIYAIGFAQQTIFHDPNNLITWQIGNPHLLKSLANIQVVSEFRKSDVAWGGEGAPLVPIFHKCLVHALPKPVAIINIGGVANVTYIDDHDLIAFDCGPGNALINDVVLKYCGYPFDKNGEIAKKGTVDKKILNQLLDDKFFATAYPKSIDRNHFEYIQPLIVHLSPIDQIATLTAFSAKAIIESIRLLPKKPKQIFLAGGGTYNKTMVRYLKEKLPINNIAQLALDADFVEAQAFAYLAIRRLKGLPATFSSTTKVKNPTVIGTIF